MPYHILDWQIAINITIGIKLCASSVFVCVATEAAAEGWQRNFPWRKICQPLCQRSIVHCFQKISICYHAFPLHKLQRKSCVFATLKLWHIYNTDIFQKKDIKKCSLSSHLSFFVFLASCFNDLFSQLFFVFIKWITGNTEIFNHLRICHGSWKINAFLHNNWLAFQTFLCLQFSSLIMIIHGANRSFLK